MTKTKKQPFFSLEVKIRDERGKKIFEWREGRANLLIGLSVTEKFVKTKLGIDWEEQRKKIEQASNEILGIGGKK